MRDYKESIELRFEELEETFEEENGRPANPLEKMVLYEEAMDYVNDRAAAYGDYLRKIEKGE